MIQGACLPRKKKLVSSALMLDFNPTLFDVDVGRAVLAHGTQLDDVRITGEVSNSKHQIVGHQKIVLKGDIGIFVINQRIRGRRLLGVMYHRLRYPGEFFVDGPGIFHATIKQGAHDVRVGEIADDNLDFLSGQLVPDPGPLDERGHRVEHADIQFDTGVSAKIIVNNRNIVAAV